MARFFKDDDFEFMAEIALGATYYGGADVGECLTTLDRIKNKDADGWFDEWRATAERLAGQAEGSERAGHAVSAREAWLRAATYYDAATFFVDRTEDPGRFEPTWEIHRQCWDRFAALSTPPIEQVEIPYEDTKLDGYLFRSEAGEAPRPLLILNNGSDAPVSSMWLQGGAGALRRGYDCLTFDGPGQGAALWRQKLYFRHDWEAVIGPVVDFALTLDGIDPERIALIGMSQAGFWVPRAVAFEDRIAAAIADPGVFDVSEIWMRHLPKTPRKQLEAGDREKFNKSMELPQRFSRTIRGSLEFRMRPYGLETPYDVYQAVQAYKLDDVAGQITTPMAIVDPQGEQFWPGHSKRLYDAISSERKALLGLSAAEGGDLHCEPKALALRDQRVFDWLDETLALSG